VIVCEAFSEVNTLDIFEEEKKIHKKGLKNG
jgi:hypothetical protein